MAVTNVATKGSGDLREACLITAGFLEAGSALAVCSNISFVF